MRIRFDGADMVFIALLEFMEKFKLFCLSPTFFELRHKMTLTAIGPEVICAAISF